MYALSMFVPLLNLYCVITMRGRVSTEFPLFSSARVISLSYITTSPTQVRRRRFDKVNKQQSYVKVDRRIGGRYSQPCN